MRTLLVSTAMAMAFGGAGIAQATEAMNTIFPNAKPGECYARLVIPAEFRTETSTVVIKEATESLRIIPAKYQWAEEEVIVSEATTDLQVMPATYGTESTTVEISPAQSLWVSGSQYSTAEANPGLLTLAAAGGADIENATDGQCFQEFYEAPEYKEVTEKVLVSEASFSVKVVPAKYEWVEQKEIVAAATQKIVEVPAVFETVEERIKVEDAKVVWKKGRGSIERMDHSTGDIMCLVEVPAVYKTIKKTVVKSPASTRTIAEPVKYDSIRVRKLVEPAREVKTEIPARYREITKRVKTSSGRHIWRISTDSSVSESARKTRSMVCKKEIPAKTAAISRKVVLTPATVKQVEVPARYRNKRVRRLVSEAVQNRIAIPAVTKEVTRQVKVSDSRLDWMPVLCETNTTSRTIKGIQNALSDAGYAVGPVNGELTSPTLSAIDQYQRANGFATGGLTLELLNKLGVDPG